MSYIYSLLAHGLPMTLLVTFGSFAIGIVGGAVLLLLRRSKFIFVCVPVRILIDIIRGLPPIVWVFIVFYGIGSGQFVFRLVPLTAALFAMGLVASGYLSEIFRGGLLAIDNGQWEAGRALGLSKLSLAWDVLMPQTIRNCIPSAATYLIGLFKDTSIVSIIGVTELTFLANQQALSTYQPLSAFLLVGVIYVAISFVTAFLARSCETRLK